MLQKFGTLFRSLLAKYALNNGAHPMRICLYTDSRAHKMGLMHKRSACPRVHKRGPLNYALLTNLKIPTFSDHTRRPNSVPCTRFAVTISLSFLVKTSLNSPAICVPHAGGVWKTRKTRNIRNKRK